MTSGKKRTGYFLFSLDTELAWGYFDKDDGRHRLFSKDGSRERKAIDNILKVFEEFEIIGTWAVVGHLFYRKCEECEECPIAEWEGKHSSYEQIYGTEHPLWYGADVIERILGSKPPQEIAFHGYTHDVFTEHNMNRERALFEIREWLRLAEKWEIAPKSVVFPRDRVGYLPLLAEAGFSCYRSEEHVPLHSRARVVGPVVKTIDHLLSISSPPIYELRKMESNGLVNLKASQHLFGFNRRVERILDALDLHLLRFRRIINAIREAAEKAEIIHLWAHPWEFKTDKDIDKLRYVLGCVAEETGRGRMRSVSMAELAEVVLEATRNKTSS
jgi:hypothetical protein